MVTNIRRADLSYLNSCFTCIYSGSHYEDSKVECIKKNGCKSVMGDYINSYFDVCDEFSHRGE